MNTYKKLQLKNLYNDKDNEEYRRLHNEFVFLIKHIQSGTSSFELIMKIIDRIIRYSTNINDEIWMLIFEDTINAHASYTHYDICLFYMVQHPHATYYPIQWWKHVLTRSYNAIEYAPKPSNIKKYIDNLTILLELEK